MATKREQLDAALAEANQLAIMVMRGAIRPKSARQKKLNERVLRLAREVEAEAQPQPHAGA